MTLREDLTQFATDAAINPKVVATVSTATSGAGISTAIGWLEKGIGVTASAAGLLLVLLMVRKVLLESEKLKLENAILAESRQQEEE